MNGIHKKLMEIQTKLVAPKNQYNAFGKYNYRSCEDIQEALKPLLKETDTVVLINDEVIMIGERYYVKATATLTDGENSVFSVSYAREEEKRSGMAESQITGATSSYARKYALNALFLIDDTKDADSVNKHGKETTIKEEVMALAKKKFSKQTDFKEFLARHDINQSILELDDNKLGEVLDLLNERVS